MNLKILAKAFFSKRGMCYKLTEKHLDKYIFFFLS